LQISKIVPYRGKTMGLLFHFWKIPSISVRIGLNKFPEKC